jgi:hypothetical protein
MELTDGELGPCDVLQRELGEACVLLDISLKIPELSMRVCISFSIKLVHLHCVL